MWWDLVLDTLLRVPFFFGFSSSISSIISSSSLLFTIKPCKSSLSSEEVLDSIFLLDKDLALLKCLLYYETLGVEKLDRILEFQNSAKLLSYKNLLLLMQVDFCDFQFIISLSILCFKFWNFAYEFFDWYSINCMP